MLATTLRAVTLIALLMLGACNSETTLATVAASSGKGLPDSVLKTMQSRGMPRNSPVMARIFKEEGKFEVWKAKANGRYDLIAIYDICTYSGQLGPKFTEGDRQAPEGFYTVRPSSMNPQSSYYLSFNIGYPNAYDRVHGRSGTNLMVHGGCSSSGCYSMTDNQMEQIYAFARDSFEGGQTEFQIQSLPFRMTAENMARYRNDPNYPFWEMLKEGYDYFEITKVPPKVDVCEKRYVFNRIPEGEAKFVPDKACPPSTQPAALVNAYQARQKNLDAALKAAKRPLASKPALSPSIDGSKEAAIVAEWTKQRARGERVPVEPPSLESDGSVKVTSRMGRIDSEAGRRMAAADAAAAEKERAAAAKRAEEQRVAAAKVQAEAQAEEAAAATQAEAAADPATTSIVTAPAQEPGMLTNMRRRLTGMFGS